uniref:Uncharacterized protein n=1 Tax=Meloidogyne enterolobii TaxID=390850 RepID=A0A6V7TKA9_MELEN|nr:unnamed protein product [Meloidogyne enterolobii]
MALEQHSQILTPTNIKKRKTIPPELIVDIFKTINTFSNVLSRDRSKDSNEYFDKILLKEFWTRYAKKLMTSSSIVYSSAGNIFRQVKKHKFICLLNNKMSDASKPAVGQRDLIEEETLAENILKEEVNVGDDDPNDKVYWIRNFLQAMDMKKLYEKQMSDQVADQVAELTRKNFQLQNENFHLQYRFNNLKKEFLKTGKASETMLQQQQRAVISPTVSPSKLASSGGSFGQKPAPSGVNPLCAVCVYHEGAHKSYNAWTCDKCSSFFKKNSDKEFQPCDKGGNCTGSAIFKCGDCHLKKM